MNINMLFIIALGGRETTEAVTFETVVLQIHNDIQGFSAWLQVYSVTNRIDYLLTTC